MRALFVIHDLGLGGTQRQMASLASGLLSRGHEVEFFSYAPHDPLAPALRKQGALFWLCPLNNRVAALRERLREGKYNVVLSYGPTPNLHSILAARTLLRRPKVVVAERLCDPAPVRVRLVRRFYRYCDYVVCNSYHQRDSLLKACPWLDGRIDTIYNGCDLSLFRPAPDRSPAGHLRILAIAPVTPAKNGICLVRALKLLWEQKVPPPQVTWIGERFPHGWDPLESTCRHASLSIL